MSDVKKCAPGLYSSVTDHLLCNCEAISSISNPQYFFPVLLIWDTV